MGAPGSGTPRDPLQHPQFTPRPRFATFAPRLVPFGSFCRDRPPVCSENDAFRTRNGDLNLGPESRRRSTGLQRNRFRPSPPASIRNFCSTSGPVWLRFWRRSTGLQRERCVSDPRLGPEFCRQSTGLQRKRCVSEAKHGPEFSRRSTGLQRERSLFRPSLGPERKSSFRCRPNVVPATEATRAHTPGPAAGSGSGASGRTLFDNH